jgi:alpha-beta hydrolase superfamily lysophospholipase
MREDVEFACFGGVTLRGWLYRPVGEPAAAPAIVMAHGFSATRHMALTGFAEAFCAAGIAALVYDHRHLGDSAGEPRQEINPWAQSRDYRYALSWLADQPGIDPDRLAIWGSSFSGGEVLVVGAVDPRVKAVIANVPFAGLLEDSPVALDERFAAMRAALEDESGCGPADTTEPPIGPLPVIIASGFRSRSRRSGSKPPAVRGRPGRTRSRCVGCAATRLSSPPLPSRSSRREPC